MSRGRRYLEKDVLTAARERIEYIYDMHDTVVVCFSGGKDSLALLHLAHEYQEAHGLGPVKVVFRDEEVIPNCVIDFVNEYRQKPWVDLRWLCLRLVNEVFVLGKVRTYTQWDPARAWVREQPEWAEIPDHGVLDQYTADTLIARAYPGKVCLMTGVRAAESNARYFTLIKKLKLNYMAASADRRVSLGKPIFDWEDSDVFKFFHEREIRYCEVYDSQLFAADSLRVSTPLHAVAAKKFGKLRETDPDFYDRVCAVFPEMLVQDRYWSDYAYKLKALSGAEDLTFEDIRRYAEQLPAEDRALALPALAKLEVRHAQFPDAYPLPRIFRWVLAGNFAGNLLPITTKDQELEHARRSNRSRRLAEGG